MRTGHFCIIVSSCFSPLLSSSTATVSVTVKSPPFMLTSLPLRLGGTMILCSIALVS